METKAREPPDRGPPRFRKSSRKPSPRHTAPAEQKTALQVLAMQGTAALDEDDQEAVDAKPILDGQMQDSDRRLSENNAEEFQSPLTSPDVKGLHISALEPDGTEARRPNSVSSPMDDDTKPTNGYDPDDTLATSPNLRDHTIAQSLSRESEK